MPLYRTKHNIIELEILNKLQKQTPQAIMSVTCVHIFCHRQKQKWLTIDWATNRQMDKQTGRQTEKEKEGKKTQNQSPQQVYLPIALHFFPVVDFCPQVWREDPSGHWRQEQTNKKSTSKKASSQLTRCRNVATHHAFCPGSILLKTKYKFWVATEKKSAFKDCRQLSYVMLLFFLKV